jgi:hypothetical protein
MKWGVPIATPVAVSAGLAGGRGQRLGDPEVGDHHPSPAAFEEDVVGLHVTVDDADRVRGAQGVRGLDHDAADLFGGQVAAALEALRDGLAVHVRHHEIDEPVGALADRVDRHDVRMRQARRRLRLAQEPQADLLPERELRRQDLDGHAALEALIVGVIHHAHPAAADLALEGVGLAQGLLEAPEEGILGVSHAV